MVGFARSDGFPPCATPIESRTIPSRTDLDGRALGGPSTLSNIPWELILASPIVLAFVSFLIVLLRLETAKIEAQLRQVQERNNRIDLHVGLPATPITPLTVAERKANGSSDS